MKTKFYCVAFLASAALIAQAKAGGHHGGGGGGGSFAVHASAAQAHAAASTFQSAPRGNFGGGRFVASGQRFSSVGVRSANSFRQQRVMGSSNITTRRFENRGANAARERVLARRTADWHRDWDRRHDHWWNGHRCRFVNGSWFIYDIGFYPYDYWYPYDYYAYNYYPYEYDPGVYEGGSADHYDQGGYDSSAQYAGSIVANAQEQLAGQGYYRGEIDGTFGPETRRAIMRYQSDHGLRVTGSLNTDTLHALGLRRVASN